MTIFRRLKRIFGLQLVYVRVRVDSVLLREVGSGKEIEDAPILAVSTTELRTVLAVGRSANNVAMHQQQPFELINGFLHPRTLISDVTVAGKTLQHFVHRLFQGS